MLISGLGLELECRSSVQDHDLGRDNCFYILILINIKPKWPKEKKNIELEFFFRWDRARILNGTKGNTHKPICI